MGFVKFSILWVLLVGSAYVVAGVDIQECFQHDFSLQVAHKVKPFGLFKNILSIDKKQCVLTVKIQKYKYLTKQWTIDVCREPIHIKYGTSSVDVLKRKGRCADKKSSFCKNYFKLVQVLEDDGLIFAAGNRNNLSSEHGEVFCTFKLVKAYLAQGNIFGEEPVAILSNSAASSNSDTVDKVDTVDKEE